MRIIVNGEPREVPAATNVAALVRDLQIQGRHAVEVNAVVIPRSSHDRHLLAEGDRVEIVRAIGGG